jgi:hypothetical protein
MGHISLGREYRGRRVKGGPVIYIACEGERGLGARTEAFRRTHLTEQDDPPFYLLTTRLDLVADCVALVADIRAQIGATAPVAVVIDTLNRSISGSESKDEDMGAYVKAADAVREAFACAVILIHHCGIDGSRPRGHTSLTGAADAQIAVKKDASGNIVATVEYMKDGAEGEIIASALEILEVGADEDGDPITSCVIRPADGHAPDAMTDKLSPSNRRALELLTDAVAREGVSPPVNEFIPTGKICVTVETWRRHCYERDISVSEEPDAKRQAFNRAVKALLSRGAVGKWQDFVWVTQRRDSVTERDIGVTGHGTQSVT